MATYHYKCETCKSIKILSLPVSEHAVLASSGDLKFMHCEKCSDKRNFVRIFGSISSTIIKDKETLLSDIKEEARKITEKVKSGDQGMIRQIYGEEA